MVFIREANNKAESEKNIAEKLEKDDQCINEEFQRDKEEDQKREKLLNEIEFKKLLLIETIIFVISS